MGQTSGFSAEGAARAGTAAALWPANSLGMRGQMTPFSCANDGFVSQWTRGAVWQ
jgi:hypothetical protein